MTDQGYKKDEDQEREQRKRQKEEETNEKDIFYNKAPCQHKKK